MSPLPASAAAERNRAPIWDALHPLLPARGRALEIACGTGQHAAHFAAALPGWSWQPSDLQGDRFDTVAAWAARTGASNVLPAIELDVLRPAWPTPEAPFGQRFDLIYCANLLHISPSECTPALMQGASRYLSENGLLAIYGPFLEQDVDTAASNLAFDADLRARDPLWGLRRREWVQQQAESAGLKPHSRHSLPANNLLLVFARARGAASGRPISHSR